MNKATYLIIALLIIPKINGFVDLKETAILPNHLYQELQQLPNNNYAYSVLEQNAFGKVYVNSDNRFAIIRTNLIYTLLVGTIHPEEVAEIAAFLHTLGQVTLICLPQHHYCFVKQGFHIRPRIELTLAPEKAQELPYNKEFNVAPITQATIKKCNWHNRVIGYSGSEENFLHKSFGFFICDGDVIASEIFADFIGNGMCEICIMSHPDYRGKGYLTSLLRVMYEECTRRKLTPITSCDAANIVSFLTCSKLFTFKQYYALLDNYIFDATKFYEPRKTELVT